MTKRESLILVLAGSLATSGVGRYEEHKAHAEQLVDDALKEYAEAERVAAGGVWWSDAHLGSFAESVKREHAHELAEELRKFVGPRAYPHEAERVTRYVAGWHDAANHIDPEVP